MTRCVSVSMARPQTLRTRRLKSARWVAWAAIFTEPSVSLGRPETLSQAVCACPLEVLRRELSVLRNPRRLANRVGHFGEQALSDRLRSPGWLRGLRFANR